ncbi:MAG: Hsp20/alpha crystallin family protein [Verrucomicrobia bacterium]|nr:Hsp20/alpha crystallin family protein [Verrucomicrobiota bacterium]
MPKYHASEWERIQRSAEKSLMEPPGGAGEAGGAHQWIPSADVYETPERWVVKMEVAGINREDVEITLDDRTLVVRGCRPDPCRTGQCKFRQVEIDYGQFERRFIIPKSVDAERVTASYRNGFLVIELPKSEKAEHATVTVIVEEAQE